MVNQQLINYIKKQIKAGYDVNTIKSYLTKHGYKPQNVNDAINSIYSPEVKHVVHHISKTTILSIAALSIIILLIASGIYFYLAKPTQQAQLLDLRTSLLKDNLNQGDKLEFNIELSNLGKSKRYDVILKHEIVNTDIYSQETIAVETSTSKTSYIQLPPELTPKRYTLKTIASYSNKKAFSTFTFNVVKKGEQPKTTKCIENWECTQWQPEECPNNEQQTRTCNDLNNCQTTLYKPETTKSCTKIIEQEPKQPTITKKPSDFSGRTIWEKLDIIKQLAGSDPNQALNDCPTFEIDSHKDECYFNIAEVTKSDVICKRITSERTKDKCYSNVAKLTSDNTICEEIIKQTRKDACYMNFVNKGDYSICDKIDNSYLKDACVALRDTPEGILVS
ncbi:hypothetical protein CEE44_04145 [Candidatus Woesearchaeota archaeon B3_Woes]|nr:MAG: hypothetical protein CEE44_04145 [Candidatus Woesearchaeota archaeon B3_Woes]